MGAPTPLWVREQLVAGRLKGMSISELAAKHQLSESTARAIWRRYKRQQPLAADYSRCGRPPSEARIYRGARYLKYLHRSWGAPLIATLLTERYGSCVSVRTLQRWFKAANLTRLRQKQPSNVQAKACAVHQVWQIDAKERLPAQASYLSMIDEHSGAFLEAFVFPPCLYLASSSRANTNGAHKRV